ncbi:helix-turn-helix transcriptional regulator [Demequina sp. NBRC 110053]|uniref:ArsR/SmtB family transcription factor n=1 Tax=Demequina sp. NBRC 110053 TaxID=1570342 RepID=UPI000A007A25|nr:metalloregulator ArsR/SmtB family transcription factor [Demequina sp. NBRC 110053]
MSATERHAQSGVPLPTLSTADATERARGFAAIAHPTRLRILSIIMGTSGGQATIGQLADALGVSQPTITHHVARMVDGGVAVRAPEGRQVWVSVAPERQSAVEDLLR